MIPSGYPKRTALFGACILLAIAATGCGTVSNARKIDYRNATTLPPLEVPPDLANVPDAPTAGSAAPGSTTYSGYAGERRTAAPGASPVLPQNPNVKLVREGQTRYIVVNAEPTAVWDQVKEFLTRTGLSIAREDPKAGFIETDWAENRASVGARESGVFSRWVRSVQSTAMRDQYRIRLERGAAPGTTEIYLTHRGMEEADVDTSGNTSGNASAGWKPRPSDPELEAEMLHRLVAQLSDRTPVQTATNAPAQETQVATPSAQLTHTGNGVPLLTLEDSLDRAWRRVGLSLDRIGFTVEDRDRSKGIYYVRYIDPDAPGGKPGFFSRMFGHGDTSAHNQFQVRVQSAENGSSVDVLNKDGGVEKSKTSERILSLLYEQLK